MRFNKMALLFLMNSAFAATHYEVQADQTYYDDHKKIATFIGHVTATEGESVIKGDKLILYFDQHKQVKNFICNGQLASYETVLKQNPKKLFGEAQHITYDAIHRQAVFTIDAHVVRGGHEITGPYVQYNLDEERLVTKTEGTHQKTHITLQPDDVETNA